MFGAALNFPCHFLQPFFLTIGSSIEAVVSLVIGEIEIIGVIATNSTHGIAEIAVPANKINSVGKAIPVSSPVSSVVSVLVPGFVHRLGIAIGRGRSRAREKAKTFGARWFGFGLKFRLLMHDGHEHGNGN